MLQMELEPMDCQVDQDPLGEGTHAMLSLGHLKGTRIRGAGGESGAAECELKYRLNGPFLQSNRRNFVGILGSECTVRRVPSY